jgi:hypothetical protein
MTRKQYAKKFTPEEREAYREQQRKEAADKLDAAVQSLQTSDGFRAWLRARAKFHNYSFNNTLLILIQTGGNATRVASAKVWNELGRHIVKGQKALYVFAPIEWHVQCEPTHPAAKWNDKRDRWERKVTGFKLVPVFDVAQTDGDPLPRLEYADAEGDSHKHLEPKLRKLAKSLGFTVKMEQFDDGTGGYCDPNRKVIALGKHLSPNGRVRVLTHEIAHALGVGYQEYGRSGAEVIVESVTYIVLAGQGFDLDATSVPYIGGWGNGNATEKMREFAAKIDELARQIESAL